MAESINILNPKTLSVQYSYDRVGDLRLFRRIKGVSVSFYVFDSDLNSGILRKFYADGGYLNVSVDNEGIGLARMDSLSISAGENPRLQEASCTFSFFESAGGDNFLTQMEGNLTYLKSISEDVSVSMVPSSIEGEEEREFSHSINVTFFEIPNAGNPFSSAKSLASSIFGNEDFFSDLSLMDGLSLDGGECSEIFSESYNSFTHDCTFSRKLRIGAAFKKTITHSITFDSNSGVATVTESADYTSFSSDSACYSQMEAEMTESFAGASTTCQGFYSSYSEKMGLSGTLSSHFFEKSMNFNPLGGSCGYSVSFSDDWFYRLGSFWSYTTSISRSEDSTLVTESGEVIGSGVTQSQSKSNVALSFWNSDIKHGIEARCSQFFSSMKNKINEDKKCPNEEDSSKSLDSSDVSLSKNTGRFSYSSTWKFGKPDEDENEKDIESITVSCTNGKEIPFIPYNENYIIPNNKEIKSISPTTYMAIDMSSSVTIVGKKKESEFGFEEYLNAASSEELCVSEYVTSATYSFSPKEKTFVSSVNSVKIKCSQA